MTRDTRSRQQLLDAIGEAAHEAHVAGVPIPEIRTALGASSYRLSAVWTDNLPNGSAPSPDEVQQVLTARIAEAIDGARTLGLPVDQARAVVMLHLYCLDDACGRTCDTGSYDPARPANGAETFVVLKGEIRP